jgi:hypothetical protein
VPFQLAFQSTGSARMSLVCTGGNIKVEDRAISAVRVGAPALTEAGPTRTGTAAVTGHGRRFTYRCSVL